MRRLYVSSLITLTGPTAAPWIEVTVHIVNECCWWRCINAPRASPLGFQLHTCIQHTYYSMQAPSIHHIIYHVSAFQLHACMHKSSSHSSSTWLHALIAFKASHACMIQGVLRKIEWEAQEATRTKPQHGIHLPSSNGYENKGYVDTLRGSLDGAASYF